MLDEIVYQTKKPVWVVCFVLICAQVIPSVSAFYLNFKSEDGMNVVVKGQISLDAIEITSGHSSVDQSDKRELLRKLDDLKTQIEARVSNADSELKQIKMIEAETKKLIGATTSWDDTKPHNKLTAAEEETQVLNQNSPIEQMLLQQIKKMTEPTEEIDSGELIQQANSNGERGELSNLDDTMARILEDTTSQIPDNIRADVFDTHIASQTEQMQTTTEVAEKIDPKILIKEAIRNDDEIKTAELIREFYDVDGERAFRPISIAAETCSVKVAEMLLQNGADVNVIGGTGWRPIHVATYADCRPIAKMLIEHGADLTATIDLGYTALRIASQDKRKNVIDLLEKPLEGMGTGCSTEDSSECATTEDSTTDEYEVNTSEDESQSIEEQDTEENPWYSDIDSETEQTDTTEEPEEINKKELIQEAVWSDDVVETELLINKYYERDVNGDKDFIPITAAAEKCSVNVAEMLIYKGANVNLVGGGGWRPIHVATYADCRPIVRMLIEHGADLSARIGLGYTALDIATHDKRKNVIDLLKKPLEGVETGCSTEDSSECTTTEDSLGEELEEDASVDQSQSSEEQDNQEIQDQSDNGDSNEYDEY